MPRLCPEPCSRFVTAFIFIVVGVVQLLVGIILLRSQFASLLSGPNFLTATTNIAVGCTYGLAGIIWKNEKKKGSVKHTARRNVLSSLLISIITINATTTIILVMGDGHKLLELYLENVDDQSLPSLFREVHACAYVTSVCSSILCIVVAIIDLSGNCFTGKNEEKKQKNSISNEDDPYGWSYGSKSRPQSTSNQSERHSLSDPASLASEDSVFPTSSQRLESSNQSVYRQEKLNTFHANPTFKDGYHHELIPRIKHSSLIKELHEKIKESPKRVSLQYKSEPYRVVRSDSPEYMGRQNAGPSRVLPPAEENRSCGKESQIICDKIVNHGSEYSRSINNQGISLIRSLVSGESSCPESNPKPVKTAFQSKEPPTICHEDSNRNTNLIDIVKQQRERSLRELEQVQRGLLPTARIRIVRVNEIESSKPTKQFELNITENPLCVDKDVPRSVKSKPESLEKIDANTRRGEVYLNQEQEEGEISRGMPTKSTASVHSSQFCNGPKIAEKVARSKTFDFPETGVDHKIHASRVGAFISSTEESDNDIMKNDLKSLEARALKLQNKRRETMRKMVSMASIAEMPSEETTDEIFLPQNKDENSNIKVNHSVSFQDSPSALRRTGISSSNLLKRMWSSTGSDAVFNVSNLIVDEDSLIGLSEEELMARTSRIRTLRKAVEKRLKEEIHVINQSPDDVIGKVDQ